MTIQVLAQSCSGELRVMEPKKQDEWRWFPFHALPERIFSPSEKFIRAYLTRLEEE